jgi:foldase protein PrsA
MPKSGHIATGATALLLALNLAACGGSNSGQIVARVGGEAITQGTVEHTVAVLKGGWTTSGAAAGAPRDQALRRQALQLLISSLWLTGEADSRAIAITGPEVRRKLESGERVDFPGGAGELREFMKSTGETEADLELQARAELARAKLRQLAIAGAPPVTQAQIAAYYAAHRQSFHVPERREARFTNRKTRPAIMQLKREVEAGKSITSAGQRKHGELFTGARVPPGDPYERAIDSGKLHHVAGPFKLGADEWLYEVVKITPGRQRTFAETSDSIRRRLTGERASRALAAFTASWRARWSAKTDCTGAYEVPGCRQDPEGGSAKALPEL